MKKILCVLLALVACVSAYAKEAYFDMVDSAEVHIKMHEWDKAETILKNIVANYPDDSNNSLIISNLATVQRYQGKLDQALKNYSMALFMTPNAVTLLKNRASLYMEMDSVKKAYKDYDRAIELDNKDDASLYYHGMLAMRLNKLETAKLDFDRIMTNNPRSIMAREGLGLWNKIKGNFSDAVKYYSEIIKEKPNAVLLANRAECYLRMKRLNDAEEDVRAALQLTPEEPYLYILRAKLYKARFSDEDVKENLKMAEKYGLSKKAIEQMMKN